MKPLLNPDHYWFWRPIDAHRAAGIVPLLFGWRIVVWDAQAGDAFYLDSW